MVTGNALLIWSYLPITYIHQVKWTKITPVGEAVRILEANAVGKITRERRNQTPGAEKRAVLKY